VVSEHIAESIRKNLYNTYGNAAILVDQVLEFRLTDGEEHHSVPGQWWRYVADTGR
jgi:hypothetical protein